MAILYMYILVVAGMVPLESLQGLQEWGKRRHGYLFRDNQPVPTSKREYMHKKRCCL